MRFKGLAALGFMGLVACSNQDPVAHEGAASVGAKIDANANVVIRQVFGNQTQSPGFDFVELFNRGTTPQSLDGWTIQYADGAWSGYFEASGLFTRLPNFVLQPGASSEFVNADETAVKRIL